MVSFVCASSVRFLGLKILAWAPDNSEFEDMVVGV